MNSRIPALASQLLKRSFRPSYAPSRNLYTDHIYPYPFKYFNEKVYPTTHYYRENWERTEGSFKEERTTIWVMRLFWTYFFWSLFHDPGAVLGHHTFPDPSKWTDEELGIPPLEAGPCPLLEEEK